MIWGKYIKMDSLRENRTKEDVVAELNMLLDEDIDNKKCIVLVEGSDDVTFMEIVLEDNAVCVESPYGGKHGLDDLMEEPSIQRKEVIAVRDKDYMDLTQLGDREFVYDGCCLETMILSNPDIAEGFHRLYQGKKGKEEYLIHAMRQLAPYSMLRKKNEIEKQGINFEKVGFGDLVKEEVLQIEELFNRIHQIEIFSSCKEKAKELSDSELWDITNGHDFYTYLGALSKQGRKTLGEIGVRNILFAMYRKKDFERTRLYHTVLEYQKRNRLKFVRC